MHYSLRRNVIDFCFMNELILAAINSVGHEWNHALEKKKKKTAVRDILCSIVVLWLYCWNTDGELQDKNTNACIWKKCIYYFTSYEITMQNF